MQTHCFDTTEQNIHGTFLSLMDRINIHGKIRDSATRSEAIRIFGAARASSDAFGCSTPRASVLRIPSFSPRIPCVRRVFMFECKQNFRVFRIERSHLLPLFFIYVNILNFLYSPFNLFLCSKIIEENCLSYLVNNYSSF